MYRHGDSSRHCTVATVQDEANPSSIQPAASCCVASESTEAHRDGCREYVLAEESVLLGNSRREREAFSSMLSAARSTREARYEQMCHLLSHQWRLEAETPAMPMAQHHRHHTSAKQLGCSHLPIMRCIHLVVYISKSRRFYYYYYYYYWALQHSDNTEVTVENKEKRLSVLMDWRH